MEEGTTGRPASREKASWPSGRREIAGTKQNELGAAPARVVRVEGRNVVLAGSPLTPSRPGCAGDRGSVQGARVLEVYEEEGGLLHLLARKPELTQEQPAMVRLDLDRRDRLARTHAASVIVRSVLAVRSVPVNAVEIEAGRAWIETAEEIKDVGLSGLAAIAAPLRPRPLANGRMLVDFGGVCVQTVLAPIAASSRVMAGIEVNIVPAPNGGSAVLEIALTDGRDRWWR